MGVGDIQHTNRFGGVVNATVLSTVPLKEGVGSNPTVGIHFYNLFQNQFESIFVFAKSATNTISRYRLIHRKTQMPNQFTAVVQGNPFFCLANASRS